MSSNPNDCSSIEERIYNQNLYISTTQDQLNKLDPNEQDVQEKREALTRKLNALHEQLGMLQNALQDCRQGKAPNFPDFDIVPEDGL
jgi:archaellum component FlaC